MKMRSGQVAVYLALVLVAITFLVLMNVGTFLGVSARNTTMNGGDAAALAVARHQGELLNRIGRLNEEHLRLSLEGSQVPGLSLEERERIYLIAEMQCRQKMDEQRRACFLGPLEGIRKGHEAASRNGCDPDKDMWQLLWDHANEVVSFYVNNPDLYPEPWPGAWREYASELRQVIGGYQKDGLCAGPDNISFLDGRGGHMLYRPEFYEAIAAQNWCWFRWNAFDLLSSYDSFRKWGGIPSAGREEREENCCNSEIYSLHLVARQGNILSLLGGDDEATNIVKRIGLCTDEDIACSCLVTNENQVWYFYDAKPEDGYAEGRWWREWTEIKSDGPYEFPAMGSVRPEYDILGTAAACRTFKGFVTIVAEDEERVAEWPAAAKPFGWVENLDDDRDVVTALRGFVIPAFTDAKLIPLSAQKSGQHLATADPAWITHVRKHLDGYLDHGPTLGSACWYCQQLLTWERASFRARGKNWLRYHASDCVRPSGSGGGHGGAAYGH